MESKSHERQHEETIVPVKPGIGVPLSRERRTVRTADRLPLAVGALGAGVLAVLAYAVFVWLPEWVAQPASEAAPQAAAVEEPEPAGPSYSAEELAALQSQTERLLSRLLVQQSRVAALSPQQWAASEWEHYRALARAGDDAYLADAYWDAVPAYSEALELGQALQEGAVTLIEGSLEAGLAAIEAGDAQLATEQFALVRVIDEGNGAAARGLARAERLPEVLDLMTRGDDLREAGELGAAAEAYRQALALDAAWAPARTALADVDARLEQARFDAVMSRGLGALAAEDFGTAREHFETALEMRRNSPEARDGLSQAEQGTALDQIALAEARALAFERRELWAQAIEQYQAALATDATLAFATAGLERARARADLDAKLAHLVANPNLLLTDQTLTDAEMLLADAERHESPAGRLTEQIAQLTRLVNLAATPLTIHLRSDGLTEVTLYRVGSLGTFSAKELQLRPGTYTAVGSRVGYRDVRETFTLLPGRELPAITIACVERI